jgi:copper transport protein
MAVMACLAVALALPAFASAHAALQTSNPEGGSVVPTAPTTVSLTFNEPVETALGAIRVFDAAATRVDGGDTSRVGARSVSTKIPTKLANGTYTVSWRVASSDGHPIEGAFVFHVGAPGERPEGVADQVAFQPPAAVARAQDVTRFLNLALLLTLIGGIAVNLAIFARRDPEVERRLWYVIAGIGFALSIITAASVILYAAAIAGSGVGQTTNSSALSAVLGTRFGHVRLAQLILAEIIAIAAVWAPSPGGARWLKRGIGALAVGLAVTPGLSGHAGSKGALAVIADTGHVLAASVWVGGLVVVMLGLRLAAERRTELSRAVFPAFSTMALGGVAVLLVSGTIGGLIEVNAVSDLWGSTYGRLLLAKIAIAATLIGFGVANRRSVRALVDPASADGMLSRLRRSIVVEFALMALAVGVTSVIISKAPATALARPVQTTATATGTVGDLAVRLVVDPAARGENTVEVFVSAGGDPRDVDEVTVTARPQVGDIGPFKLITERSEAGHYVAPSLQVPVDGVWNFNVAIRRGEFDLQAADLTLPIRTQSP